jgi:quercetin dioxygenase-like cupin family protein
LLGWCAAAPTHTIGVMTTTDLTTNDHSAYTQAGSGPHHLMLGTVAVSRLLGGRETQNQLSLVELVGAPGSGPGPHVDPWQESFYVLDGELTFRCEERGAVRTIVARRGDTVSIPQGVGHAFSVTGGRPARYLIATTPAGLDAFFADAGEPLKEPVLPSEPPAVDRERLRTAFARHGLAPHAFPASHGG